MNKITRLQNRGGHYWWNPAKKLQSLGYGRINLGQDRAKAEMDAIKLNAMVEQEMIDQATLTLPYNTQTHGLISMESLCAEYIKSRAFTELAFRTQEIYTLASKRLIQWAGNKKIDTLQNKTVAEYYHTRAEETLATASQEIRFLSRLCNWGIENSLCEKNPAGNIRKKNPTPRTQTWTDEQFSTIVKMCDAQSMYALADIIYLARFTAQRMADLIKLDWEQVDMTTGMIYFKQQKTGTELTIPIAPSLHLRLKMMKIRNTNAKNVVAQDNNNLTYDALRKQFDRIKQKHLKDRDDIQPLMFHSLRRTVAKAIAESGGTVEDYMRLSGHKTAGQAMEYWQAGDKAGKRAVSMIELNP